MKPVVSIICLAYNHEKYIREALDGFVMQKTDFPFEIVMHDDASTDDTAAIIREYEARFPGLFKPIYQTENQYTQEKGRVTKIVFNAAKGKYIALCEGDDYWTDPLKLQKQVDFMEKHSHISLCGTYMQTLKNGTFNQKPIPGAPFFFDQETLIKYNPIYTLTSVFKNIGVIHGDFSKYHFADKALWRSLVSEGGGVVLPFVSGVYRIHRGGAHSSKSKLYNLKNGIKDNLLYLSIEKNPRYKYVGVLHYLKSAAKAVRRLLLRRGQDNLPQIPLFLKAAWKCLLGRTMS